MDGIDAFREITDRLVDAVEKLAHAEARKVLLESDLRDKDRENKSLAAQLADANRRLAAIPAKAPASLDGNEPAPF